MLKKDMYVLSTINESHFSPDYTFSYENGFNVAVAFTQYGDKDTVLDPTYGELIFNHYKWGPTVGENDSYGSVRERM